MTDLQVHHVHIRFEIMFHVIAVTSL